MSSGRNVYIYVCGEQVRVFMSKPKIEFNFND